MDWLNLTEKFTSDVAHEATPSFSLDHLIAAVNDAVRHFADDGYEPTFAVRLGDGTRSASITVVSPTGPVMGIDAVERNGRLKMLVRIVSGHADFLSAFYMTYRTRRSLVLDEIQ